MEKKKELKVCGSCLSGNIGKKFHESDFDMRFKKGHKLAGIDFCLDCGSDDIYTVKNLLDKAREEGIREAVEEAYEYGRDSIRLPMSLTIEQVIDKLLNK